MIEFENWGLIDYKIAWDKQKEIYNKLLKNKDLKGVFVVCQHPTVITLGRNSKISNILFKPEFLEQMGVKIYEIERGGDVTLHNPGQIVGYPIFNLTHFKQDLHWFLREIEQSLIDLIAKYNIIGSRVDGLTGVWIDGKRKIAAIGLHCSRWITSHGFALNVNNNLLEFSYIVPCGISDKEVTSINKELGREIDIEKVINDCKEIFLEKFK